MLISEGHQQTPHAVTPAWTGNRPLQSVMKRLLDKQTFAEASADCKELEVKLTGPIHELRTRVTDPQLIQYDQYGRRVDRLITSEGWRGLKGVLAEEGVVSIPYLRKQGASSRVYSFLKSYLLLPETAYTGCPIAMTDGCARVLELAGTEEMKRDVLPRLLSRDSKTAWTSGQWMTERPGGSDVSLTETTARPIRDATEGSPNPGDAFILDGFKWFSSATDGDVAVALARTGGEGSAGLSLFLVKMRNEELGANGITTAVTNGIHIHRLKNKFGTKAVPTAELSLQGCVGHLIGNLGDGVRIIASVLNITRAHSAVSSVAALGHSLNIAKAFAQVRHVGGKSGSLLSRNEMHTAVLAESELVHRALLALVFGTVALLGKAEATPTKMSSSVNHRLRLLTPVVKSFAADLGTAELLKLMESLGGQGYMTENEMGELLANASVERIWEGTTNTLAHDVTRVITKSRGQSVTAFIEWSHGVLQSIPSSLKLDGTRQKLIADLQQLDAATRAQLVPEAEPRLARPLLYLLGYVASSVHLVEQAIWSHGRESEDGEIDKMVLERWVVIGGARQTRKTIEELLRSSAEKAKGARELEAALVYGRPIAPSKL